MKKNKVKISDLLQENGLRFKPDDKKIHGLKRVDKIDFSGNICLSDSKSRTDMIIVNSGDLLISGINVHKGALNIYEGTEPVAATIHYSSYKINNNMVSPLYLIHLLRSNYFLNRLKEHVAGGIKTEIKAKHLLPLEIEIHELRDQLTILEKLSFFINEYDILSAELNLQEVLIKSLKSDTTSQIIMSTISENKNFHEIEDLIRKNIVSSKNKTKIEDAISSNDDIDQFDLPKGVHWIRLGYLLTSGPTNGYSPKGVDADTGKRVLTLTATTSGKYNPNYFKNFVENIPAESGLWLKINDILIQRGNTIEYVGISALVDQDVKIIYPDLMIKINVLQDIYPEYIVTFLNSSLGRQYAMKNAKGAQKTMPKINQGVILSWPIILPPKDIQQKIILKVKSLESLVLDADLEFKKTVTIKNDFIESAKEKLLDLQ